MTHTPPHPHALANGRAQRITDTARLLGDTGRVWTAGSLGEPASDGDAIRDAVMHAGVFLTDNHDGWGATAARDLLDQILSMRRPHDQSADPALVDAVALRLHLDDHDDDHGTGIGLLAGWAAWSMLAAGLLSATSRHRATHHQGDAIRRLVRAYAATAGYFARRGRTGTAADVWAGLAHLVDTDDGGHGHDLRAEYALALRNAGHCAQAAVHSRRAFTGWFGAEPFATGYTGNGARITAVAIWIGTGCGRHDEATAIWHLASGSLQGPAPAGIGPGAGPFGENQGQRHEPDCPTALELLLIDPSAGTTAAPGDHP
jgi:hypothetical protein